MRNASIVFNFRVSNHNLPVERDRYEEFQGIKGQCKKCNMGARGDEYHVFLCPSFRSWQLNIARKVAAERNSLGIEIDISKCESDFNNDINDPQHMRDLMLGDTGVIRLAFARLPSVLIQFLKKFWCPFNIDNWFC